MAIMSVDLAFRRWTDLGLVVLDRPAGTSAVHCEILTWDDGGNGPGPVEADILAGRLNHFCNLRNIRVLMLDGPQAWKSRTNGHAHARTSERILNTAAKTGPPGMVKPSTYRGFAEFCVDVYDALCRRGWKRLDTTAAPTHGHERVLVESYPCAAWKALGLKALASKRRARVSDLATSFAALNAVVPLQVNRPPNHDQLQAIVGGLPGIALEVRNYDGARIVGTPPRREDGQWREGFIVLPLPPKPEDASRLSD
ncbi:MAG TPA: hypothetical protein VGL22_03105 [Terracidiphilus sp.]